MSAAALEPVRWTRRRWITTIATIFLGQIALLLYFGERPHGLARAARPQTSLYFAGDPWSAKQLADLPMLDDPTLFALPSLQGFSGKAWLTFPLLKYEMREWTEPPSYLALDRKRLAKSFAAFAATSQPHFGLIASKSISDLLTLQLTIPPLNVRTASQLRVEGSLEKRRLLSAFKLPIWPYDDLLPNTVVQLLVNEQGDTISTALLTSSKSKQADDYALKCAAAARFESLRGMTNTAPAHSSGRFVFQWHTIPSAETNSLSTRP